jgi:hypothetical protein
MGQLSLARLVIKIDSLVTVNDEQVSDTSSPSLTPWSRLEVYLEFNSSLNISILNPVQ